MINFMSDKIKKLQNYERSERALGNAAAADAYGRKIAELKKKETETRKAQKVEGEWQCSCGMTISLNIDAGQLSATIAENTFLPHRMPGHKLRQVK